MADLTIVIGNKNYSSWSLRGWLATQHTGMAIKEIKLQLDTPSFYSEIEKYNPAHKVPTLIDGTTRVWDSAAIIDYCARLAPEKYWWPEEMSAYAYARSIFAEMHSGFTEVRNNLPMNMRLNWSGEFGEGVMKEVARIEAIWTEARQRYCKGGDFLFGGFSAADMMYAPVVSRFTTYNVPVNDTAKAYMEAVRTYPAFVQWRADSTEEKDIVKFDEIPKGATKLG